MNFYPDIDEKQLAYIGRVAAFKVRIAAFKYQLPAADLEDLQQELVAHAALVLHAHDESLGSQKTFIDRVISHKLTNLIKQRMAQKRDFRQVKYSLNETLDDGDDEPVERIDLIDRADYLLRTGRHDPDSGEAIMRRLEIDEAIEALPPELKRLARELEYHTLNQIHQDTGIPESSLYRMRDRIRTHFSTWGYDDT